MLALALLILTIAGVTAVGAEGPPLCSSGCATAVSPPDAAPPRTPFGIVRSPLGSIWFALNDSIGRIDRQGDIATYPLPEPNANVGWLATNDEGSVWFVARGTGKLGRVDADGTLTEYSLPTATAIPQGIVFAPDGNVYVTEQGANAIARVDPATGAATDIPVPTPNATVQSGALGPDGAIWFIERSAAKVGRMTLDGQVTEYPLAPGSFPNRIVAGPDGALWFTELFANKLGRITTSGALTEYPLPGGPVGITVGKDRQLYVALTTANAIARVDLDGDVTGQWQLPAAAAGPLQIATGFGLDIWATRPSDGTVLRLTPYATGNS
jgi:virginiamycin B lyase